MKLIFRLCVMCLLSTQFFACSKDASTPAGSIPASAVAGNFTVSSFINSGDASTMFNGYEFTFNQNGTIVATNGSQTFSGTWRFDDGNSSEIKIYFAEAPLNELNKSWHIEELNDDHMLLSDYDDDGSDDSDDDNGSHHDSHLEFERD